MQKTFTFLGVTVSREVFMYLLFGVLTTVTSYFVYILCILSGMGLVASNTVSTVFGILFAFGTNKIWVFESRSYSLKVMGPEFLKFSSGRVAVYFVETALLVLIVDTMGVDDKIAKIITMAVVVVSNYIISKKLVFQ